MMFCNPVGISLKLPINVSSMGTNVKINIFGTLLVTSENVNKKNYCVIVIFKYFKLKKILKYLCLLEFLELSSIFTKNG